MKLKTWKHTRFNPCKRFISIIKISYTHIGYAITPLIY